MSEEKPHFKLQIGKLNKNQLRELVGVIHFLSNMGLLFLKEMTDEDWDKLCEINPAVKTMHPERSVHCEVGEICTEAFAEWYKQILIDFEPDEAETVDVQEFRAATKDD